MKLEKCRQFEEILVQRDVGTEARSLASIQHHLPSCPVCRRHQRTWSLVRQSALAANDVLDDLMRARVLGRVQARLGAQAAREGGPERRIRPRHTRVAWSLGFAAATILAFVLGTRLRRLEPPMAVAPLVLEPYALHPPAEPGSTVPRKGLDRLELPAHASMRARLGAAADLTLLGPLELTVRDGEKQRVELDLARGTVLGDFDGSGGRRLRISTRDATIDIVGTRFMVDALAARTRVAVAHGLVRVESKGRLRMVGTGLAWSTDREALETLDAGTARMFERAASGQWEEVVPEHPPGAARGETPGAGASKREKTTGRGKGVGMVGGAQRPARQRRVHVRHGRFPRLVDAGGASETEHRTSQTNAPTAEDAPAPDRRLALAVTPPVPTGTVLSPVPPAPLVVPTPPTPREGPPSAIAPSPAPASPEAPPRPVPAPPAPSRATVSSLYKDAEQALRRGDDDVARQRLVAVVRTFPRDVMADAARFELALLANKDGDQREALAQIRQILGSGPGGPFVEPARFLRCRVYLKEDRDAAETCLVRFVRDYPRSSHGDVALRALIELSRSKDQCGKAFRLAETYLQRYPKGAFAEEAARVRSHCGQ